LEKEGLLGVPVRLEGGGLPLPPSLEPRARRYVVVHRSEVERLRWARREQHAVRDELAPEAPRREVRDDDDATADEGLGLKGEGEARDDRARLGLAEIHGELEELVLLRHALGGLHDPDAEVDLVEVRVL